MNPFVYDRPLSPDASVGRLREQELVCELALSGQSSRLIAPRRYGKTTLLSAAGAQLEREGYLFVHVDFSRVRRLDDVALRLHSAWERSLCRRGTRNLWRKVNKQVSGYLEVGVPGLARGGITIAPARHRNTLEAIHKLLAIPERLGGDRRAFICFDEFAELLTARDDIDGIVRSHIQHHGQAASYCFAGSQASVMQALFADRRRPLFAQAREVQLDPIRPEALRPWLETRFNERPRLSVNALRPDALAEAVVARTGGHPQRAMMLAHFIWQRMPAHDPNVVDIALGEALGEASGEIEQLWRGLDPGQRRALATAAAGYPHLLGRDALALSGNAKSTMQAARKALLLEGILRDRGSEGIEVTDPFVPLWLEGGGEQTRKR